MGLTNNGKSYLYHRAKSAVDFNKPKKMFVEDMVSEGYKKATASKYYKYAMIRKQEVSNET